MAEQNKFEFKELDNGKYAFVMHGEDIERTEVVSKQYAKDHYKEIKKQKADLMQNLSHANKDIERAKIVKDDELDHFVELANKAAEYAKGVKAMESRDSILEMIDKINLSMTSMEQTIPELKRMSDQ